MLALHSESCVIDRLEIRLSSGRSSRHSEYKLSYRKQGFHEEEDWIPFQATPDWTPTPGLGSRWTIKLDEEERRLAAPCAEVRLDLMTTSSVGFYAVNVFGWTISCDASFLVGLPP